MTEDTKKKDKRKLWDALSAVARAADEEDRPLLVQQMADWDEEDAQAKKKQPNEITKNN